MNDDTSWVSIFGAITGAIGAGLSIYLLIRQLVTERTKLFPYTTDWEKVFEIDGTLVVKVRLVITNNSRVGNSVRRVLLKPRGKKNFAFENIQWSSDESNNRAHIEYNNGGQPEAVCPVNEKMTIPLNVEGRHSEFGWLAFAIPPVHVNEALIHRWCIIVHDQDKKHYLTPKSDDQFLRG